MSQSESKLGFSGTWSMAVGGMIGGGIFSTLGVVVAIAGAWTWLSFAAAGLIALAAGYSYVKLADHYGEGGGAFTFLREINAEGFAGSLSWVLIVGYVLTNAVYAFTFGQYLGHVVGLGPWFPRVAGIAIVTLFIGLNLRGVGEAGGVEVFLVWFKLVVLVGLAGWGLAQWDFPMLSQGTPDAGVGAALFGAASVFMAYEGFQLLTYDYEDIETPRETLPRAVLSAIIVVIVVYVVVALGTAMLIGADQVVQHKEVALAIAGQQAFGIVGLVVVTIAAAFSTGSAINATLFATARLASRVAEDGEFPAALDHKNAAGIPDRAVIWLGTAAAVLAAVGTLTALVEAASLAFLFTFAVVCGLAFRQRAGLRIVTGFGALAGAAASVALVVRLVQTNPLALVFLGLLILVATFGRPVLLRHVKTETKNKSHSSPIGNGRSDNAGEAPSSDREAADGTDSHLSKTLKIYLVRHGETEWSLSGQHSGRADIPLTAQGEEEARNAGQRLRDIPFDHVLTSPLQRAQKTCALAALGPTPRIEPDLAEWDNGDDEGRTSAEILKSRPDWNLFRDGSPNGETPAQISARADRLIAHLRTLDGDVALFSHSHFGRVLAARWIGLSVEQAEPFLLSTGSISVLCYAHESTDQPAVDLWNSVGSEALVPASNADVGERSALQRRAIQRWENEGGV